MAAPAKGFTLQRAAPWEVMWGTETVGFTEDVDPSGIVVLEREKRIQELEDMLVDIEAYGMEGVVSMNLNDVGVERLRQMCPWAGSTGAFSLTPPTAGYSYYNASKLLTLHPRGVSGTASDQTYGHAFPRVKHAKGGGAKNWQKLSVIFVIFADHTALVDTTPTVVGGYAGPTPA